MKPLVYILHYTQEKKEIKYYYLRIDEGRDKGKYEYVLFFNHLGFSDQRPSLPVSERDIIHTFNWLSCKSDTSNLIETDNIPPELATLFF